MISLGERQPSSSKLKGDQQPKIRHREKSLKNHPGPQTREKSGALRYGIAGILVVKTHSRGVNEIRSRAASCEN